MNTCDKSETRQHCYHEDEDNDYGKGIAPHICCHCGCTRSEGHGPYEPKVSQLRHEFTRRIVEGRGSFDLDDSNPFLRGGLK